MLASRLAGLFASRAPGRVMLVAGLLIVGVIAAAALAAPLLAPCDPTVSCGPPLQPPSPLHPLGTNQLGQDVFSRILYGGRTALYIVALSLAISAVTGSALGMLTGLRGGVLDRAVTLIMDSLYAFPGLILAIALAAVLGPRPENAAVAIAVTYIPMYYRVARGQTLNVKTRPFVEAGVATGVPLSRLITRYILPSIAPGLAVVASMNAADSVLMEAALGFLGLTVTPPTPDWGFDLYAYKGYALSYPWLVASPGLAIMLLATGFALLGEGLAERLHWGGEQNH